MHFYRNLMKIMHRYKRFQCNSFIFFLLLYFFFASLFYILQRQCNRVSKKKKDEINWELNKEKILLMTYQVGALHVAI